MDGTLTVPAIDFAAMRSRYDRSLPCNYRSFLTECVVHRLAVFGDITPTLLQAEYPRR